MKLSCTDVMVPGDTLEEKAKRLKDWGFDGIAVFSDYRKWNDEKFDEVTSLKERTGINVCEFVFIDNLYGHLMDNDLEIKKQSRQMYKDTISVCRELGAISEMEHDYGAQDPLPLFEPYQKMPRDEEAEFIELIKELADETKGTQAKILIEPINRYETKYLTTLAEVKDVLMKANQPNTGILADFFHLSIEEADIPESIREVEGLIEHVHLGDSNRLLPGYGHTDWIACISALNDAGFSGYMNLECAVLGEAETEIPKTAKYLKEIIDQYS